MDFPWCDACGCEPDWHSDECLRRQDEAEEQEEREREGEPYLDGWDFPGGL